MYSSTFEPEGPRRAMKIFYRTVSEPAVLLQKSFTTTDELRLSSHALSVLRIDLKTSAQKLPPSARKWQDWEVGLLNR